MQSSTILVNFHNSCPKCGASIDGDNKSCGSCGSVSCLHNILLCSVGDYADVCYIVVPCLKPG
ncbi:hypothetical protein P153DRAFT_285094 [Dothidotthia symphoricarpi CBS 119687]|uniref:Zinc-ribbon domain-containing protein n=1 Tax=Dothidotthia symphoricarpi CBS 119687 TaxID=1392245 RepID=A0A6A6AMJ1_9PLEO|nr:uncharacterized protein P153DRAFT_285094 [Dothidotthia symphoricarpi CBS 119687]KAF2132393.1 hypothetical protein P153DRAFT_285094 [Dothidotthia symphoricarpi CBS 119687]